MAMTREYLDLVENGIDIAPVGSQEEVQAAEFMLDAFEEHGLATELQDLSAPLYSRLIRGIALLVVCAAAVFCGLGGIGWAILGFLLALGFGAYLGADYLGQNPLGEIGPKAESQNVIGVHRGEGPLAGRGVRPVVVLARYDTGREELLCKGGLAQLPPILNRIAPWCLIIVVVGAMLQLFQFIAGPALIVLWIITMVAALPLLALGINDVTSPFMSLTDGANDNKASLAALLGVLEDVVPTDEDRLKKRAAQLARAQARSLRADADDDGIIWEEYEAYENAPVVGVRHGKQVLEAIGMLPPTCEIVYEKPEPRLVVKRRPANVGADSEPGNTAEVFGVDGAVEAGGTGAQVVIVGETPGPERSGERPAAGNTEPIRMAFEEEVVAEPHDMTPNQADQVVSSGEPNWGASEFDPSAERRTRRSVLFDLPDPSEDALDPFSSEVEDETHPDDQPTELVTFPDRGEATEQVERIDVYVGEEREPHRSRRSRRRGRGQDRNAAGRASEVAGEVKSEARKVIHKLPFGRKKREEESLAEWLDVDEDFDARTEGEQIGTWDRFDDAGRGSDDWRGGAVRSEDARRRLEAIRERAADLESEIEGHGLVEGAAANADLAGAPEVSAQIIEDAAGAPGGRVARIFGEARADAIGAQLGEAAEEAAIASLDTDPAAEEGAVIPDVEVIGAPTDDELTEAVLEMGDVNLVAHDIWFVCVGASALGHAGTKAFVEAHRRELRGCFVINLDSVGAGELTAITSEGYGDTRRDDRKIGRLVDVASKVLHIPVIDAAHDWEDTDATPALRRSMRGLTLMGTVGGKHRALANTAEDIVENVNPNQVVYASQLVSEVIRRA